MSTTCSLPDVELGLLEDLYMPSIQDKIDALEEDNVPVIYGLWTKLPTCYRDQPAAEESLLESLEQSYSPEKCQ
ncbi:uncharacterized protein N7458_003266 [Penicillium daleae]|uniref:Uncharacterized protein n=1 Tax=Penicillium daleae TaxID=63821 RepID=A0AAD6CEL3_9EURO|nr:uncharacterized protein N7458_003266 [Penicillium daleae]KAJ5461714.1 hypothetical protein N7458_003266 [Penicillium daleae]